SHKAVAVPAARPTVDEDGARRGPAAARRFEARGNNRLAISAAKAPNTAPEATGARPSGTSSATTPKITAELNNPQARLRSRHQSSVKTINPAETPAARMLEPRITQATGGDSSA